MGLRLRVRSVGESSTLDSSSALLVARDLCDFRNVRYADGPRIHAVGAWSVYCTKIIAAYGREVCSGCPGHGESALPKRDWKRSDGTAWTLSSSPVLAGFLELGWDTARLAHWLRWLAFELSSGRGR